MSHRGVVFKALEAQALSGLMANEHLQRVEAGPKCWSELDLRMDLAHGALWSVHLEANDTWTKHNGPL
jgi:hypothetical protein